MLMTVPEWAIRDGLRIQAPFLRAPALDSRKPSPELECGWGNPCRARRAFRQTVPARAPRVRRRLDSLDGHPEVARTAHTDSRCARKSPEMTGVTVSATLAAILSPRLGWAAKSAEPARRTPGRVATPSTMGPREG